MLIWRHEQLLTRSKEETADETDVMVLKRKHAGLEEKLRVPK